MKIFGIHISILVLLFGVIGQSCVNKDWEDHYVTEPSKASGLNLKDYIQNDTSLRIFNEMLKISGYDIILGKSQAYTVWAPQNMALSSINLSDTLLVTNIVKNHICRLILSKSLLEPGNIRMLSNKVFNFAKNSSNYSLGDANITGSEILTANGIIHKLDNYNPYVYNILEYILTTEGLDSLRNYMLSQNLLKFRPDLSIVIGTDANNNKIYDSVKVVTNLLFESLGDISSEDSVFTAILPDNNAWTAAYTKIKPYFVSYKLLNAASLQRSFTQYTIVRDLFFRTLVNNPGSYDSLVTTSWNSYKNPGYLFNTGNSSLISNGRVYINNQLYFKDTLSWHKTIKIEAESQVNRSSLNANIYTRTNENPAYKVSGDYYIQVDPTSTTSKASVEFPLTGILSARYNIYCVFVPNALSDPTNKKPFKATFALITYTSPGVVKSAVNLTVTNNVTDTTSITKMKIASNYKFPSSYLTLDENGFPDLNNNDVFVNLRATNAVTTSVADLKYSRAMQIDYIVLEPIAE